MRNEIKKARKFFGGIWRGLWHSLRHPIVTTKAFIANFKAATWKERGMMFAKIAIAILMLYYLTQLVVGLLMLIFVIGAFDTGMSYSEFEVLRGRFVDNHGREAENMDELLHDNY